MRPSGRERRALRGDQPTPWSWLVSEASDMQQSKNADDEARSQRSLWRTRQTNLLWPSWLVS